MGFETPKELSRGNHPSLRHAQMPEFIAALRLRKATAALALELLGGRLFPYRRWLGNTSA
jgi:hypothetical protein